MLYFRCVVLFTAVLCSVYSYENGAPDTSEICQSMRPSHYNVKMNNRSGLIEPKSEPPYFRIDVNETSVTPGQMIDVSIRATKLYFEGFFLQARNLLVGNTSNDTHMFGTFLPLNSDAKVICGGEGITHAKHFKWTNITFSWVAPKYKVKNIQFVATVVKGYSTFFMNVASDVVTISGATIVCWSCLHLVVMATLSILI